VGSAGLIVKSVNGVPVSDLTFWRAEVGFRGAKAAFQNFETAFLQAETALLFSCFQTI
jgi:hypothetical protein